LGLFHRLCRSRALWANLHGLGPEAADILGGAGFSIFAAIALGMGFANAAIFKMVPKYVPHEVGGTPGLVGGFGGFGAFGGFAIPPVLGLFATALGARFCRRFLCLCRFRRDGGPVRLCLPARDPPPGAQLVDPQS
jgi:hypothetical protein